MHDPGKGDAPVIAPGAGVGALGKGAPGSRLEAAGSRGAGGGPVAFLLLLALLAAGPLVLGATRPWSQAVMQGVGLLLGIAVLVRILGAWRKSLAIGALDLSIWIFVAYAAVHYLVAPSEIVARREMLLIILYAIVFYAAWRHLPGSQHARAVALFVGAIAFFEAAYAVIQWLRDSPFIAFGVPRAPVYGTRAGGTFNCPNHFAGYLEMGLPLIVAFVLFSKFPRWTKVLLSAMAAVIVAGMLLSVSRGGWIATCVALGALVLFAGRQSGVGWVRPALVLGLFGLAIGAWLLASPMARARFGQMGGPGIDVRTSLYRDALKMIPEAPLFGTGPATFQYVHPRFQGPECGEMRAHYTHNDYLNLACDYGLVGVGIVGGFLTCLGLALARARRKIERRNDRALWAGSVAAIIALLVHSALDFNMHIPANAATFFAIAALPLRFAGDQGFIRFESRMARVIVIVLFAMVLGWYGVTTIRNGVGNAYWLMANQREGEIGHAEAMSLAGRALTWDPRQDSAAELAGDYLRVLAAKTEDNAERARIGGKAISYYTMARRNNPWGITAMVKQAMTYDSLRRYPEAYMLYSQALQADPRNWRIRGWLARHYWQRGMLDRAKETYERAVELGGDSEIRRGLEAVMKVQEARKK